MAQALHRSIGEDGIDKGVEFIAMGDPRSVRCKTLIVTPVGAIHRLGKSFKQLVVTNRDIQKSVRSLIRSIGMDGRVVISEPHKAQ